MKLKSIAVMLALLMLASSFTACGKAKSTSTQQSSGTTVDSNGKYVNPVVITIGRDSPVNVGYPAGDTVENNQFIKAIKDRYNIEIKYDWLVALTDYNAKVNLSIASGDVPDVMLINQQSQVGQLVEANMTEDLLPAYNKMASTLVKDRFDSFGDRKFTTGMFNGKLLALPNNNIAYGFNLLWVRQDWLKKVGAQPPKTLDDVVNLAKTFMDKDPGGNGAGKTIGITCNSIIAGTYAARHAMDPIFAVYNSFPRSWIKDASGKYSYGTIAPETKAALAELAEMYKAGLIDEGFATSKVEDEDALIVSGKAGMMFGGWWLGGNPLTNQIKNNPQADWIALQAPLDAKGVYKVPSQNPHTAWLVVKKGYENPEAVFKVLNFEYAWARRADPEISKIYDGQNILINAIPINIAIEFENIIPQMYERLINAVNTKDASKLSIEEKLYYNAYITDKANPKKDVTAWSVATSRFTGMGVASLPVKIASFGFPVTTKTMETKWANLQKLENEIMLKIVLGESPVSSFDTFVEQWKQQGGDEITKEVNAQLK